MKSRALRGPCSTGDAQSRGGAAGASSCCWQWGAEGPTVPAPRLFTGSDGCRAGHFGMDAAWDAGCPSNSCYGKHFGSEISSHIHVSIIVFGRVPVSGEPGMASSALRRLRRVRGDGLCRARLLPLSHGMGNCWRTPNGVLGGHGGCMSD